MKLVNFIKHLLNKINLYHLFALFILALIVVIITYSNLGTTKEFIGDDAGVGYHYSNTLMKYVFNMWDSYTFPGRSNVISTIGLIHIGLVNVLNQLGLTSIFVDRIFYFLFYFISSVGMYFLASNLCKTMFTASKKKVWFASMTGAIFFMLNNLTMILLSFPPTTYVYSYMFLPWIFLLYLKDFHIGNELWKKLIFGIIFLVLLSGNPSNTISIVFLLFVYELFFRENNKIIYNWKRIIPTLLLVLLLSSYMYLPIIGNKENPYGIISSSSNRTSIEFSSSKTSILNLLRLRGHPAQDNFIFNKFLLKDLTIVINYLLIVISLLFLLKKNVKRIEIFFLLTFVLFLFLSKAEHSPFSWVNNLMYEKVPFFEMYRASYFKFIYFCTFSLSIMISISILEIEKFLSKFPLSFFIKKIPLVFPLLLIIFGAKPFFFGEVVRDIHKTTIPTEYHTLKTYLSNKKIDFSVLSLPQLPSGQTLDWGNGNYYGGFAHADMFILDKPVWSSSWFLLNPILSNNLIDYKNILNKANLKYIILHKDIPENYFFEVNVKGNPEGQTNFRKLNKQIILDNNYRIVKDTRYFKIFELNKYIPHIYIQKPANTDINKQVPLLEFKKINPTKYRVVVHEAKGEFPLIFSESFHEGWKAYISNMKSSSNDPIANYKILDGNTEDQSSEEELKSFIDKGWITTLSDGKEKEIKHMKWEGNREKLDYVEKYNIDFISKNFQDTIQNDNLSNGSIFETWFKKPIEDDRNHRIVNGYANSWNIDVNKLCNNNSVCIKNFDGSYDFEVVIEFWPQRLFYIGLAISSTTLLVCISYLIYGYSKRKKHASLLQQPPTN